MTKVFAVITKWHDLVRFFDTETEAKAVVGGNDYYRIEEMTVAEALNCMMKNQKTHWPA